MTDRKHRSVSTAGDGRRPASLDELRERRAAGILAPGPTGALFVIRPPNVERHALAGGLPARLRQIALEGVAGLDRAIAQAAEGDTELIDYLDNVVRQTVLAPAIPADVDIDEVLWPPDYRWLVQVAHGADDRDGEGRFLWGKEPLSRMRVFAAMHDCPDGCPDCERARDALSR